MGTDDARTDRGTPFATLLTAARVLWQTWPRIGAVTVTNAAAGAFVITLAMLVARAVIVARRASLLDADGVTATGVVLLTLLVALPLLIISSGVAGSMTAAVTLLADRTLADRPARVRSALVQGARRAPAVVATAFVVAGVLLAALLATPVWMFVGVIGLLLSIIVPGATRRDLPERFPSTGLLLILVLPLAPAIVLLTRLTLAIPAAVDGHGPVAAIRTSWTATADRSIRSTLTFTLAVLTYWAAGVALIVLTRTPVPDLVIQVLRIALFFIVSALPVVVLAVMYRDANPGSPAADLPPVRRRGGGPRPGTSTAVVVTLVVTSLTVSPPHRAEAAAAVVFTVDHWADGVDSGDATPGDGTCLTIAGTCTLRAAIDEANASALGSAGIGFTSSMRIHLQDPLVITAPVEISGAGHQVELSGDPCGDCGPQVQILRVPGAGTAYALRDLTLASGYAEGGGGALWSHGTGTLDNVTFMQGWAGPAGSGGAIAVLDGSLDVTNATFAGSSAASGGDLHVTGSGIDPALVTIRHSTLVDASGGGIVVGPNASAIVTSSIVDPAHGAACTGVTGAASNRDNDGTCGGGTVGSLEPIADNSGPVETIAITLDSNAIDQAPADTCPATDARGIPRPQGAGCDIGAYEFSGATTLEFVVTSDRDDANATDADTGDGLCLDQTGVCTLRAAIEQSSALAALTTTITFAGDTTIALGSPLHVLGNVRLLGSGATVRIDGAGTTNLLVAEDGSRILDLVDVHLAGGTSAVGGAALRTAAATTLENVTLSGHTAVAPGGAVAAIGGSLDLLNVTFDSNTAPSAADLYVTGGATVDVLHTTMRNATGGSIANDAGAVTTVHASVVAPTSGTACTGLTVDATATIATDASCGTPAVADAGLSALAANGGHVPTVALTPASPAVNAVTSGECAATDARGTARPQAHVCDAGAFELERVVSAATLTVDVLGDDADAAPGDGTCATATGDCTLRAAVQEANATTAATPTTAPRYTIRFSTSGTIAVASPLVLAGEVRLDGGGQQVVLDGVGVSRILEVPGPWAWSITDLTFRNGTTDDATGGGAVLVESPGSLTNVTFTDNASTAAAGGAVAVLGGAVEITNATFVDNSAPVFHGGSDVYANATVTIVNSTITGTEGTRLQASGFTPMSLANTLVSSPAGGPIVCGGPAVYDLGGNFISDTSCTHSSAGWQPSTALGDHGGSVPTILLQPTSNALDGGVPALCPTHDARGRERRTGACDAGATEYGRVAAIDVVAAPVPSELGAPISITATVTATQDPGVPQGTIEVLDAGDALLASGGLEASGVAVLAVDSLPAGPHTLQVRYTDGSGLFDTVATTTDVEVLVPGTALSIDTQPRPTTLGDEVTVTVEVSAAGVEVHPSGQVTLSFGGALPDVVLDLQDRLIDGRHVGVAEHVTTDLPVGDHTLTATYAGDGTYPAAVPVDLVHRVRPVATQTLMTSTGAAVIGQPVALQATITPLPETGSEVTFLDGGVPIGTAPVNAAGTATLVTDLPLGDRLLTAEHPGDALVGPSVTAGLPFTVTAAATATTLDAGAATAVHGQPLDLVATVEVQAPGGGVPTGTVRFLDGTTELGTGDLVAGVATLTVPAGPHTLSAEYVATPSYLTSTGSTTVDVSPATTTVVVTPPTDPTPRRGAATFTVEVLAAAPSAAIPVGTVTISDASGELARADLAGGLAELVLDDLPVGTTSLDVNYLGTDDFVGNAATVTHEVVPMTATVTFTRSPVRTVTGQPVTFEVLVTPDIAGGPTPTGTVSVASFPTTDGIGATPLDATGRATITVPSPEGGNPWPSNPYIRYSGDAEHAVGFSDDVAHQIDRGTLTVDVTVSPAAPTAGDTVTLTIDLVPTVAVHPDAAAPEGWITVEVNGRPHGPRLPIQGRRDLQLRALDELIANSTNTVRVRYTGDDGGPPDPFGRQPAWFDAESTTSITVGQATPTVTIEAFPEAIQAGDQVTLTATFAGPAGAPSPSELRFVLDGTTLLGAVPIGWDQLGSRQFTATLSTNAITESGVREVTAVFPGDGFYYTDATSPPVPITVGGIPTVINFASPMPLDVRYPDWTNWGVIVTNISGSPNSWSLPPAGEVVFTSTSDPGRETRARLTPGDVRPGAVSRVDLWAPALPPGSSEVTARFIPDQPFQPARVTVPVVLDLAPSTLTMQTNTFAYVGEPTTVSVDLRSELFTVPQGDITIEWRGTTLCTIPVPRGSCEVTLPSPGSATLHAIYAGDHRVARATASSIIDVQRALPLIEASVSGERFTGDDLTLSWRVIGPTDGGVEFDFPGQCSSALEGTCVGRYPDTAGLEPQTIRVRYLGSISHEPATFSLPIHLGICVPHRIEITAGGMLTTDPLPDCNDGTGFADGTRVTLTAVPDQAGPREDRRTRWGNDWFLGTEPIERVLRFDWSPTTPWVRTSLAFDTVPQCVDVRIESRGGTRFGHLDADPSSMPVPDCPVTATGEPVFREPSWESSGGVDAFDNVNYRYLGRFMVGSPLPTPDFRASSSETVHYGFELNGDFLTELPTGAALEGPTTLIALGGLPCQPEPVAIEGPGTVRITTPSNCTNPLVDLPGWRTRTDIDMVVEPATDWFLQSIDERDAGPPTSRRCVDGSTTPGCQADLTYALQHRVRSTTTQIVEAGRVVGFTSEDVPLRLAMGTCHRIAIEPVGPGSVRTQLGVPCPARDGDPQWFVAGTTLHLLEQPDEVDRTTIHFGKWNDDELDADLFARDLRGDLHHWPTISVDRDRLLRPSFFRPFSQCHAFHVRSNHPGTATVRVDGVEPDLLCRNGDLADGPATALTGRANNRVTLVGEVTSGDPLVGWALTVPGGRLGGVFEAVAGRTHSLRTDRPMDASFTLCQRIEPSTVIVGPTGYEIHGVDIDATGADPLGRPTGPPAGDFISFDPAPNCPYDDAAWVVGTAVTATSAADPAVHTFRGWNPGGTGPLTITLGGQAQSRPIEARFDAVCHTLTIGGRHTDVERIPEPNCPGDPRVGRLPNGALAPLSSNQFSYLAGTTVLLVGKVPRDRVWEGWTGDVEAVEDGQTLPKANPVVVVMDGDRTANHRWREKDFDEEFVEFFEDVGTVMANLGKKAAGIAAYAMSQAIEELPPISWLMKPLELWEEISGVLDRWDAGMDILGDAFGVDLSSLKSPQFCWTEQRLYPDGGVRDWENCQRLPRDAWEALEIYDQSAALISKSYSCAAEWGLGADGEGATNTVALLDSAMATKDTLEDMRDAGSSGRNSTRKKDKDGNDRSVGERAGEGAGAGLDGVEGGLELMDNVADLRAAAQAAYDDPGIGWDTAGSLSDFGGFEACAREAEPDFLKDPRPVPEE